jgi:transcriptional regulator with XRE-family HTH domain
MKEKLYVRLKRLRIQRKLSMKELAEAIQVPLSTYREWEYGRAIQGEPYLALAEVLQVTVKELLSGESKEEDQIRKALYKVERALEDLKLEVLSL